jgi:hypothetical protein
MKSMSVLVLLASLSLPACSPEKASQPVGKPQPPAAEGAGDSSPSAAAGAAVAGGAGAAAGAATAAAKVTDACSLVPADLAQRLVPGASPPQSEQFPLRCTLSNGKSALGITFDTGPDEPVKGAEFIPGLAGGGYLERLDPVSRGDAYLTVILGKDSNGTNRNLHVEVAGHDGKDHKDDAIAVAREILGRLRG